MMNDYQKKARQHFEKTGEFATAKVSHGTKSAYNYYRCRCEPCKSANLESVLKSREKRKNDVTEAGLLGCEHGTEYAYMLGCRCSLCKEVVAQLKKSKKLKANSKLKNTGEFSTNKASHGTIAAYTYHGCRCESCSAVAQTARRAQRAKAREHFKSTGTFLSKKVRHGTYNAYGSYGCRCDECVKFMINYMASRKTASVARK